MEQKIYELVVSEEMVKFTFYVEYFKGLLSFVV